MDKRKIRKIIKEELKEFDVAHLPSAHSVRGGYTKKVQQEDEEVLNEDHLNQAQKMKLDRQLRELLRRAEGVDEFVDKALATYGEKGEMGVEIRTTLDDTRAFQNVRHKLQRISNYLEKEYPEYNWKFAEQL